MHGRRLGGAQHLPRQQRVLFDSPCRDLHLDDLHALALEHVERSADSARERGCHAFGGIALVVADPQAGNPAIEIRDVVGDRVGQGGRIVGVRASDSAQTIAASATPRVIGPT